MSILIIFVGLSALVIIHELGHFLASRYFGLLIEEFGFGIPPRIFGKKWGETLISLNWLPFGGFVKIYGERQSDEKPGVNINRSFSHQSAGKKALIIIAGVIMNFLLGWFLISLVFMAGLPQSVLITEVKAGSIAQAAGLAVGDQFTDFKTVDSFIKFVEANKGKQVLLKIQRNSSSLNIPITPRIKTPEGEGNLGLAIVEAGLPKTGFFPAIWQGLIAAIGMVGAIFLSLGKLIAGIFVDRSILTKFVGPIGIVNIAIQTTKLGIVNFLQLLALISLNLAVFNVLPIPALDGGHLLFILIEKIKGSAIQPKIENLVNSIGFAFLLLLILTVTVKDILTLL